MRAKSAVSWLKIFLLNSPAAARRRRRPAAVVIDTSGVRRNLRTGAERRACAASGDDACRFLTHEIVQILSRFTLFRMCLVSGTPKKETSAQHFAFLEVSRETRGCLVLHSGNSSLEFP